MSTNASRRGLLGAFALLPLSALPLTAAAAAAGDSPDAELIRVCHRFAEADYDAWYRYCAERDEDKAVKQDVPPDFTTLAWIAARPAFTPEGWVAKALACSAWNREMYDDDEDHRNNGTLLASLLQDMAAPARHAILSKLQQKYGPLPEGYSPDWQWIGRPA